MTEPGTWTAVVRADRDYYDSAWAADLPSEERSRFPEDWPERRIPLSGTELLIGRRSPSRRIYPEIDLTASITDAGVDREHAKLVARPDGGWSIVALQTVNGTLVNGHEIPPGTPVVLRHGDCVTMGMWTALTITRDQVPETAGQGTSPTASDIVDRYVAVWNEADPAARRAAIAAVWAPGGVEFLDGTQYRGHEQLAARVASVHEAFVGSGKHEFTSAGDAARHDDIVTFTVQLTTPGGKISWTARVFLLLDPDDLIREDYRLTVQPHSPV